jgi:malate dehydrogenase (oxaloacetate-decarboxylating)
MRDFDLVEDEGGTRLRACVTGAALLRAPLANKGTAFTAEERAALGLDGLLPPAIESIEQQMERAYATYGALHTSIAKHQFLRALQDRQEILFGALLEAHLEEMMPVVYTPTVGEGVQRWSELFQEPRGMVLARSTVGRAAAIARAFDDDVRLLVVTDSSAILGIGDQGYGGIGISIGKLALYTVGGLSPFHSLPVGLDVGTDRKALLEDPRYLGERHARLKGDPYFAFLDLFVAAVKARWPKAIVQWEDFGKEAAHAVLERYRDAIPSFNDDIQGTGAVALAGLVNACRLKGEKLRDQRVVVHGAGAGGIGVATAIHRGMMREGLTSDEAHARIFVTDSKGLLVVGREMDGYKRPFAQPAGRVAGGTSLLDVIRGAKATVLVGLSGQPNNFDEPIVRAMREGTERPVIFPLSNPTASCEAEPAKVLAWTEGRAIVATGSPFDPVDVGGERVHIGQGNNAFVFPGLGLGAVIAEAKRITDAMVLEAAYALADMSASGWPDRVYPPITALQDASKRVARRVVKQAIADGVSALTPKSDAEIEAMVDARFWRSRYPRVERA